MTRFPAYLSLGFRLRASNYSLSPQEMRIRDPLQIQPMLPRQARGLCKNTSFTSCIRAHIREQDSSLSCIQLLILADLTVRTAFLHRCL